MSRQILIAARASDVEMLIEQFKEQGGWIHKSYPNSTYVSRDRVEIIAESEEQQVIRFRFNEKDDGEISLDSSPIRPHASGQMMYWGTIYASTRDLRSDCIRQPWERIAAFTRKHFVKRSGDSENSRRAIYVGPSAKLWLEEQNHFLYCG